jgi:hypothetical protein
MLVHRSIREIGRRAHGRDGAGMRRGRDAVSGVLVEGVHVAREHATPLELCTHGLSLGRTRLFQKRSSEKWDGGTCRDAPGAAGAPGWSRMRGAAR